MKFDQELDLKGKSCPLPIALTKQALDHIPSGFVIKVITTDCSAVQDFKAWAKIASDEFDLIFQEVIEDKKQNLYIHYLKKK